MKSKLTMILFVLVLGVVLTASLVAVNDYTDPIIRKNEEVAVKSGVLQALGIPHDRGDVEEVFSRTIEVKQAEGRVFYVAADGTIAFPFSGTGLWGPITGIAAVSGDLGRLKQVTIMHQEETPGLGSRIAEKDYLGQYDGLELSGSLKSVPAGKGSRPTDIDAITGATLSSNAFVDIMNDQIGKNLTVLKGAVK